MLKFLPTLAALLCLGVPAAAQHRARVLPDGSAVGGSVGAFIIEGEPIYTIGLSVLGLRAGRVSADFALSLPPQVLPFGAVVLAADVAAAYNLALPGATLLLKMGPSVVLGAGGGGAGGLVGLQGGLGLVFQVGPSAGLRIDLLERLYVAGGEAYALPSLSFGVSALPARLSP